MHTHKVLLKNLWGTPTPVDHLCPGENFDLGSLQIYPKFVLNEGVVYLSGPQHPLLVQTVNESCRQPDVVPHYWFVVRQAVDAADASAQISVDHRGQFTISELKDATCYTLTHD